jgi:hypothetical protein
VLSWFPFFSLRRIISARSTASSTESILKVIILLFQEPWRRSVAAATTAVNTGVATRCRHKVVRVYPALILYFHLRLGMSRDPFTFIALTILGCKINYEAPDSVISSNTLLLPTFQTSPSGICSQIISMRIQEIGSKTLWKT